MAKTVKRCPKKGYFRDSKGLYILNKNGTKSRCKRRGPTKKTAKKKVGTTKVGTKKVLPICDRKGYKLGPKGGQYMLQDGKKVWCTRPNYRKKIVVTTIENGKQTAQEVLPGQEVVIRPAEQNELYLTPLSELPKTKAAIIKVFAQKTPESIPEWTDLSTISLTYIEGLRLDMNSPDKAKKERAEIKYADSEGDPIAQEEAEKIIGHDFVTYYISPAEPRAPRDFLIDVPILKLAAAKQSGKYAQVKYTSPEWDKLYRDFIWRSVIFRQELYNAHSADKHKFWKNYCFDKECDELRKTDEYDVVIDGYVDDFYKTQFIDMIRTKK